MALNQLPFATSSSYHFTIDKTQCGCSMTSSEAITILCVQIVNLIILSSPHLFAKGSHSSQKLVKGQIIVEVGLLFLLFHSFLIPYSFPSHSLFHSFWLAFEFSSGYTAQISKYLIWAGVVILSLNLFYEDN